LRHGNRVRWSAIAGLGAALAARPAWASGGIEIMPDWPLLGILLVAFALLTWPVNALIFRPLFRVLDERERRIEGARERAREVDAQAGAVLARYEEAVARARDEAAAERRTRLDATREEEKEAAAAAREAAEGQIDSARREIAEALREARAGLRPRAEALAREAAERILGRGLG
jgi:F-type H+-transporting ATPase subunit b